MGAPSASALRVLTPVGQAVRSDRPLFRWTAHAGASGYVVTVLDEHLTPVATSPTSMETRWTPGAPLPRGRTYVWQVAATRPRRRSRKRGSAC
jgi:hypothetical protein